jgi:hypothetical protein
LSFRASFFLPLEEEGFDFFASPRFRESWFLDFRFRAQTLTCIKGVLFYSSLCAREKIGMILGVAVFANTFPRMRGKVGMGASSE